MADNAMLNFKNRKKRCRWNAHPLLVNYFDKPFENLNITKNFPGGKEVKTGL